MKGRADAVMLFLLMVVLALYSVQFTLNYVHHGGVWRLFVGAPLALLAVSLAVALGVWRGLHAYHRSWDERRGGDAT